MQFYHRIKKYLFLLACVFSLSLSVHAIFVYVYEGAKSTPERGGTFSIGILGASPSLNPTQYTLDNANDFALRFLYRGLLKYNPDSGSIEGDLANCDVSKISEIRCFFKTGALWSDGTRITLEDILATYSLLAETEVNKRLQSGLSKFAITREGDAVVFRSTSPSSETLQYLTIPIIKKSTSEKLRSGETFQDDAYSGNYQIEKREMDSVRGSENITLWITSISPKNQGYSRILLKYYPDEATLIAQKDGLNLFYPGYYETADIGARFMSGAILTPDFIGAFLNTERLDVGKRMLIASIIWSAWQTDWLMAVKNPFFSNTAIVRDLPGNLDEALQKVGYFRKSALPSLKKTDTQSGSTSSGISYHLPPSLQLERAAVTSSGLRFFDTPGKWSPYETSIKDEILLWGTVPKGVTGVFINSYRLKGFTPGSERFSYRARRDLGNLKIGVNRYVLSFEKNGQRETAETLEIRMGLPKVTPEVKPTTPETENKSLSGTVSSTATGATPVSTGTGMNTSTGSASIEPPKETPVKTPEQTEPIESKDDSLYTASGSRAVLTIKSISPRDEVLAASKRAVEALEKVGFQVIFEEIENSPSAILEAKKATSKKYDVLIAGVNLWFLGTYISPYFHSGQAQNWYNFSLLRNPSMDVLLEELNTRDVSPESRTRAYEKMNEILKKESVLVPLGTHPLRYFIDKNILDFTAPNILPSATYIDSAIHPSYLKKTYLIQWEEKSVSGFFDWCSQKLNQ